MCSKAAACARSCTAPMGSAATMSPANTTTIGPTWPARWTSHSNTHTVIIFDGRWKQIRCEGVGPVMWDLETDPDEQAGLGTSLAEEHVEVRARLEAALLKWATQHHGRITATETVLSRQKMATDSGILIGFWDEAEYEDLVGKPLDALAV